MRQWLQIDFDDQEHVQRILNTLEIPHEISNGIKITTWTLFIDNEIERIQEFNRLYSLYQNYKKRKNVKSNRVHRPIFHNWFFRLLAYICGSNR